MCGRFTLKTSSAELVEIFRVARSFEYGANENVTPTQIVAAVRHSDLGRELVPLRWGLIPSWASDPRIGSRMINARSETAATKPSFRSAIRRRRCLIVADGFYEWRKPARRGAPPFRITLASGKPFAMAGLWERWEGRQQGAGGSPPEPADALETCTILTTQANDLLRDIHDRMPVIVDVSDYDRWLDPGIVDPLQLADVLAPYPSDQMQIHPPAALFH